VLALAALACICAAEPLVATLYGEHFERSVPVLRVLAVDLVVSALALVFHRFLGAIDRQRAYLQSISIGVCLNSLLACLLVSRYGALGAAGSTLVSEATALALLYRHARAAECGVGLARVLARTGASIAFGLAAWQLVRAALGPEVGDWIGMLAALPVCAAALVVLGAVPRADLEAARAALRLLKVRCQPGLVRDRMREPDELRSAAPHCAREDRLRKSGVGAGSRAGRSRRAR
jgi:O-antigen/teichoic acid export membrane protein